jgi:hypothetical protein
VFENQSIFTPFFILICFDEDAPAHLLFPLLLMIQTRDNKACCIGISVFVFMVENKAAAEIKKR